MGWLDSIIDSMDTCLSKLQEIVKDREAWHFSVYGVTVSSNTTQRLNNSSNILHCHSTQSLTSIYGFLHLFKTQYSTPTRKKHRTRHGRCSKPGASAEKVTVEGCTHQWGSRWTVPIGYKRFTWSSDTLLLPPLSQMSFTHSLSRILQNLLPHPPSQSVTLLFLTSLKTVQRELLQVSMIISPQLPAFESCAHLLSHYTAQVSQGSPEKQKNRLCTYVCV